MKIYNLPMIRFRDVYELCKHECGIDVDYWDLWDMLTSNCERYSSCTVRINFLIDGFLNTSEDLDDEELLYNRHFNSAISAIKQECLSHPNWIGNEIYIDMPEEV